MIDGFVCTINGKEKVQGWLLSSGPERLGNGDTVCRAGQICERSIFWEESVGQDQDFHFRHVMLNVSLRCQGGVV